MKKIVVDGIEYLYQAFNSYEDYTIFYKGYEECITRKYWLFGAKVSTMKPKEVFTIYCDIESPYYTKENVKSRILEKLKLLSREEEIEKGEII
jgi:hypothetical protein